jgi:hypothetical protein
MKEMFCKLLSAFLENFKLNEENGMKTYLTCLTSPFKEKEITFACREFGKI